MAHQFTPDDRRRIAAVTGINEQYLYQCLTGRRDMNPTQARKAEEDTGGEVTRQMLCQKTYAGIWPELTAAWMLKQFKCCECGSIDMLTGGKDDHLCNPCKVSKGLMPGRTPQQDAYNQVSAAISRGDLAHPSAFPCADCGAPSVHYDHRDYSRPLQVDPVCRRCNYRRGPALGKAAWAVAHAGLITEQMPESLDGGLVCGFEHSRMFIFLSKKSFANPYELSFLFRKQSER